MSGNSDFFVALMSNACTDEYTENSLSSFSNKLPQNVVFDNLNEWFVSVHSLGVSTKFFNVKSSKSEHLPNFKLIVKVHDPVKSKASILHKKFYVISNCSVQVLTSKNMKRALLIHC